MSYSPPKKATIFFSFLFLALGIFLIYYSLFGLSITLPALTFGTYTSEQVYGMLGLGSVFLSWLLYLFYFTFNLFKSF
ncbi:MAG: hypothetical protein ACTSSM_14370 [Promethearchaeota archaeon]